MENVYHHLARFSSPTPSLQLSSVSDESLVLLYSSHSDEVELMATFTPADVIRAVRLGSRREGQVQTPAGSFYRPPQKFGFFSYHHLNLPVFPLGECLPFVFPKLSIIKKKIQQSGHRV